MPFYFSSFTIRCIISMTIGSNAIPHLVNKDKSGCPNVSANAQAIISGTPTIIIIIPVIKSNDI